ncbi:MAG: Gfo/Idh/MocA family oxidoreductase [Planctomycetes bacterium]|nr:Gfo/Idh/MocA family oxidoreductase [Planctomycetota bacterium]
MNTRTTLRVAVIGAGRMGRHHARVYSQMDGCELVAVVDKDLKRAAEVAREFGGQPAETVDGVCEELDAVTVAVPTVYHSETAIPLIERGVAVLVEKPLAPDTRSAGRILEAARRTGVVVQVGHSERFNPVVQAMLRMEVVPRFIETHRISPFTFRSADIGVVFDMMIHDIDIVLHLARDRDYEVDAVGVNVLGRHEDVANARIRFSNGTVANLTASRLALKTERRIRVFCPTAYLSMDYQKKSGVAIKVADNLDLIRMAKERDFEDLSQMQNLDFGSMIKVEPLMVDQVEPLRAEIASFIESVRNGTPGAASVEEGYAAVEMAERVTASVLADKWGDDLEKAIAD